MSSNLLEEISSDIKKLSESEQLLLASKILDRLVSQRLNGERLDLRDLRNTGKGTWSRESVQTYINRERNGWERCAYIHG